MYVQPSHSDAGPLPIPPYLMLWGLLSFCGRLLRGPQKEGVRRFWQSEENREMESRIDCHNQNMEVFMVVALLFPWQLLPWRPGGQSHSVPHSVYRL